MAGHRFLLGSMGLFSLVSASAPGRSRTYNLPLKRRWLCRLSYECDLSSTHNHFARQCTGKDLNLQPPASKAGALPVELPVLATRVSAPCIDRVGRRQYAVEVSNLRPPGYQPGALPLS